MNYNNNNIICYSQRLLTLNDAILPTVLDIKTLMFYEKNDSTYYYESTPLMLVFSLRDKTLKSSLKYEFSHNEILKLEFLLKKITNQIKTAITERNFSNILSTNIPIFFSKNNNIKSLSIVVTTKNSATENIKTQDIQFKLTIININASPVSTRDINISFMDMMSIINICEQYKNNYISLVFNSAKILFDLSYNNQNKNNNGLVETNLNTNNSKQRISEFKNNLDVTNNDTPITENNNNENDVISIANILSNNKEQTIEKEEKNISNNENNNFDDFSSVGSDIALGYDSIKKNITNIESTKVDKDIIVNSKLENNKLANNELVKNKLENNELVNSKLENSKLVNNKLVNNELDDNTITFNTKIITTKNLPLITNILNNKFENLQKFAYGILSVNDKSEDIYFTPISYLLANIFGTDAFSINEAYKLDYGTVLLFRKSIKEFVRTGKISKYPLFKFEFNNQIFKDSIKRENYINLCSEIVYLYVIFSKLRKILESKISYSKERYQSLYVKTVVIQRFTRLLIPFVFDCIDKFGSKELVSGIISVSQECSRNGFSTDISTEYKNIIVNNLLDFQNIEQIIHELINNKNSVIILDYNSIDSVLTENGFLSCGHINNIEDVKSFILKNLQTTYSSEKKIIDSRLELFLNCISKFVDENLYSILENRCTKFEDIKKELIRLYESDKNIEFPEMLLKILRVMELNNSNNSQILNKKTEIINKAKELNEDILVTKSRILNQKDFETSRKALEDDNNDIVNIQSVLDKYL